MQKQAGIAILVCAATLFAADDDVEKAKAAIARDNYTEGVRLLKKAYTGGSADAAAILGYMYYKGSGLPPDSVQAQNYIFTAAMRGDSWAQGVIGDSFALGLPFRLTPQVDAVEAKKWYERAAENGSASALRSLADLYSTGQPGIEKNHDKALELYLRAANLGDTRSQEMAARYYEQGTTKTPASLVERCKWLNLAYEMTKQAQSNHRIESYELIPCSGLSQDQRSEVDRFVKGWLSQHPKETWPYDFPGHHPTQR